MMKTVITLVCDLCGRESEEEKAKGWIHFSQDDLYEERKWIDRHLCNICVGEIEGAIKRSK